MLVYSFSFIIYIVALRYAANYADAEDASYLKCCILGFIIIIVQLVVDLLLPNSFFLSGIITTIIGVIICMKVLKIPSSNFLMFIVMFAFFKVVINGTATLVINGIIASFN